MFTISCDKNIMINLMSHLQVIYLIINEKEYNKYSYIAAIR